jgi:hypothetical protein
MIDMCTKLIDSIKKTVMNDTRSKLITGTIVVVGLGLAYASLPSSGSNISCSNDAVQRTAAELVFTILERNISARPDVLAVIKPAYRFNSIQTVRSEKKKNTCTAFFTARASFDGPTDQTAVEAMFSPALRIAVHFREKATEAESIAAFAYYRIPSGVKEIETFNIAMRKYEPIWFAIKALNQRLDERTRQNEEHITYTAELSDDGEVIVGVVPF